MDVCIDGGTGDAPDILVQMYLTTVRAMQVTAFTARYHLAIHFTILRLAPEFVRIYPV